MANSRLINIIKKRYAKIDKAFKKVSEDFATEDIHQLRLQVKKLNSFLGLVSIVKQKGVGLKLPEKLHQFYNAIGAIRSLQLQRNRFSTPFKEDYSLLFIPYLDFLSFSIDGEIESARKLVNKKKAFAKERDNLLKQLPSKLRPATCHKFARHRLHELKGLMHPSFLSDECLHSVRKLLKDILYTWSYTTKRKSSIPKQELMSKREINSIIKILGIFRDKCEGLDLLHIHYKQQQIGSTHRVMWRRLENTLWHEKELERIAIHKLFHKEFSSLLNAEQFQEHALPLPIKQLTV